MQVISDYEWEVLKPLLTQEPVKRGKGMPHADFRCVFNTIFWILKTGARWVDVPRQTEFTAKSTDHRWLQKWYKNVSTRNNVDSFARRRSNKRTYRLSQAYI